MPHTKSCFSLPFALRAGAILLFPCAVTRAEPGALEAYLATPDSSFSWQVVDQSPGDLSVTHLELHSQTWRGHPWTHHLQIVRPKNTTHPELAFLYITGDGDGRRDLSFLKTVAERAGIAAAVLTRVPNQPLYDGRKEDSLIAYTFAQYLKTEDQTWPLLFPMVKSAVRAMDAIQAFAGRENLPAPQKFVVAGASKRGWTTWLTGAVDPRVEAIAPMVIDMLNMKAQLQWAKKVYGKQSEQIRDYTELQLDEKMDDPRMVRLRSWVDPYSYRERYTLPKLLLLGTNDPYWTVDSLRHYWNDLPGPKLIFQTPNAGHNLGGGKEAIQTLAAWVQLLANHESLPRMDWQFSRETGELKIDVHVDAPAKAIRLWTAHSTDRDFRNDKWTSRDLEIQPGSSRATARLDAPAKGYEAGLVEVELATPDGHTYRLSTEARVVPDLRPE